VRILPDLGYHLGAIHPTDTSLYIQRDLALFRRPAENFGWNVPREQRSEVIPISLDPDKVGQQKRAALSQYALLAVVPVSTVFILEKMGMLSMENGPPVSIEIVLVK